MNIEIANRLVNLRKKNGLSQEELAAKLGLSRQAVSKWERAEASPDTDNLICLAKLYGVSLDELLKTDDDVETIVKEQTKEEAPESVSQDEDKEDGEDEDDEGKGENDPSSKESFYIGSKGIHIKDGDEEVHIGPHGIYVHDSDGSEVNLGSGSGCSWHWEDKSKIRLVEGIVTGSLLFLITAAYVICGCLIPGVWNWGWVAFFAIPLAASIFETIRSKTFASFLGEVVFLSCIAYFAMGYAAGLWHPSWVVFLSIPLYAIVGGLLDKCLQKSPKFKFEGTDKGDVVFSQDDEEEEK